MAFFFDANEKNTGGSPNLMALGQTDPKKDYQRFKEQLHHEVLRSQRRHHAFTLMRVTIDSESKEKAQSSRFAELLESIIREYDLFCYVNSAEFAIVLPETNETLAEKIAERIKDRVVHEPQVNSAASIGIACFPHDGTNAEDLLQSAERDLNHHRKKNGD